MHDKIKWSSIAAAAVYIISGISLLLYPGQLRGMFCDLFGIAMIIYGIINIVVYFMIDIRESLFRNDFSAGIIKILLGIMIIYHKSVFQSIIPFLLAIAVIASGFSKLQDGVDSARIGFPNGWQYVAMASISVIAGVVLMLNVIKDPDLQLQVAGASLLYCGLTDLYATLTLSGKIKKFLKNGGVALPAEPKPQPQEEPSSTAQYVNWNTSAEGMEVIREDAPQGEAIPIPPAAEAPKMELPQETAAVPELPAEPKTSEMPKTEDIKTEE